MLRGADALCLGCMDRAGKGRGISVRGSAMLSRLSDDLEPRSGGWKLHICTYGYGARGPAVTTVC